MYVGRRTVTDMYIHWVYLSGFPSPRVPPRMGQSTSYLLRLSKSFVSRELRFQPCPSPVEDEVHASFTRCLLYYSNLFGCGRAVQSETNEAVSPSLMR